MNCPVHTFDLTKQELQLHAKLSFTTVHTRTVHRTPTVVHSILKYRTPVTSSATIPIFWSIGSGGFRDKGGWSTKKTWKGREEADHIPYNERQAYCHDSMAGSCVKDQNYHAVMKETIICPWIGPDMTSLGPASQERFGRKMVMLIPDDTLWLHSFDP